MKMYAMQIGVDENGDFYIEQPRMCEENQLILFHPDQTPAIIKELTKSYTEFYDNRG